MNEYRRELLRFVARDLPGWLLLGFYLADRRSSEMTPVDIEGRAVSGTPRAVGTISGSLTLKPIRIAFALRPPRVVHGRPAELITV